MNKEYEIYGYAVEILNKYIGPKTGKYLGKSWTYYNKKIYDTEDIAKRAFEENPYKHGKNGFMADFRIVPLYSFSEKFSKLPLKPEPPVGRLIREGSNADCPLCHSTVKYKWFGLGKSLGCIQPECKNYYKNG